MPLHPPFQQGIPSVFPAPDSSLFYSRRDTVLVMRAQVATQSSSIRKQPWDTWWGTYQG